MSTQPGPPLGAAPAARAGGFDPMGVLMGVAFALMWSSAFSTAKVALADAPPLLLLMVRFLVSGLAAIGIGAALGQRLPSLPRQWAMLVLLGLCQNSLYLGLFFVAMTSIPAGLAAIIASAMPLIVAAASPLVSADRLRAPALAGLLLGFGGVVAIMADRLGGGIDVIGLVLCLVGVSALAGATLVVRHANLGSGLLMIVGIQMMVGAVSLAPFALAFESFADVTPTLTLGLAFAYQAIVPGVLATLLWFALIRRIGAPRASAYHFLNPGFGVAVAWLLLGEPIGLVDIAGVAVVAIGILLVQLTAQRRHD